MSDDLRTRTAAVVARELVRQARESGEYQTRDCYKVADAVIRELPELLRVDHIRQICVASMNQDRDDPSSDRRWLADSILNILNGTTDE